MKIALSLTTALILTVAALAYSLWDVDLGQLYQRLRNGQYGYTAPFLVLLALHFWLKAVRWVCILKPLGNFTTAQVFPAIMIGFAGNNLLPAHLGEVIRTVVFARRFEQPLSEVFISQMLERILDVIAILAWYLVALVFLARVPDELRVNLAALATVIGGVCAFILFVLVWPGMALKLWHRFSKYLPPAWGYRGEELIRSTIRALSSLRSSKSLVVLVANSVGQWGLILGMLWISLWVYGVMVSLPAIALLLAVVALAVALPSSPGYIGAMQAAFVFALIPFGVGEEAAFAASVFYLSAQWVPVTLIGLFFFATSGIEVTRVRRDLGRAGRLSSRSDSRTSPRRPDFFLVGAPKCGTTAMHLYLSLHPDVFMPAIKEINYFGSDLTYNLPYLVSPEDYVAFFAAAGDQHRVGESSVMYLYSRRAAGEIHRYNPGARILIMLRNPVETMYAHHSQLVSTADENILDFEEALAAEERRFQGQDIPELTLITDYLFYRQIVRFSKQVSRYFNIFGRERVHVVLFDGTSSKSTHSRGNGDGSKPRACCSAAPIGWTAPSRRSPRRTPTISWTG